MTRWRQEALLLLIGAATPACQDYLFTPESDVATPYEPILPEDGWIHLVDGDKPPEVTYTELCPRAPDDDGRPVGVVANPECSIGEIMSTFKANVEWSVSHFSVYPESAQILNAPTFGHLDDDDESGVIGDDGDVPDVVVVTEDSNENNTHGILRVIRGDGSRVTTTADAWADGDFQIFPYRYSGTALGDLDLDGEPEIVFVVQIVEAPPDHGPPDTNPPPPDTDDGGVSPVGGGESHLDGACRVAAANPDGTLDWVAYDQALPCGGHAPAISDLEGDGRPEVVLGPLILDGETGAVRGLGRQGMGGYFAYEEIGTISFAIDLDGDGLQEVVAGHSLYDDQGLEICTAEGTDDGFPAAADFDGDGYGEVVIVGNGRVAVFNHHCRVEASWAIEGGGNGGPPTVADFDGDGGPEIGLAGAEYYSVYEPDGHLIWTHPVVDASSHATGSSVYDFNADGRAEVVYADEIALYVLDGPTGEILMESPEHTSRTLHDYPVVGDVDADGVVEVLVVNGGGHHGIENTGLYLLENTGTPWQSGRPVWNQHAYNITNINGDLSIPPRPDSNWPTFNTFRSGDLRPQTPGATPDAQVQILDVCTECSRGVALVTWRVVNGGMADLEAGIDVTVWALGPEGERAEVELITLNETVRAGRASAPRMSELVMREIPYRQISIHVDAPTPEYPGWGRVRECIEDNNEAVLLDGLCP